MSSQTATGPTIDEHSTGSGAVRKAPTDHRINAILEQIPDDAAILDIGAVQHEAERAEENDWLHKHLLARSSDVVGIDYEREEVEKLQEQGYNMHHANAETMDLGETFDVVVAGELIEHLANPGQFLSRAREHLTDDGKLILTTPNAWGACYLKRTLLPGEVHCNEEHTCWYDRRTLRQLVERQGFEIETQEFLKPPFSGEYLSWACWNLTQSKRLGALTQMLVATPSEDN